MKLQSTLKPGLDEKRYENALIIELAKRGHRAERQTRLPCSFRWPSPSGRMTPEAIVHDLVIVDPKVVDDFHKEHFSQVLG